jgi:hypothetical protein
MEPVPEIKTLPLSIADLDSAAPLEPAPDTVAPAGAGSDLVTGLSLDQQEALAAVTVLAGEVEAAEWALNQLKTSCNAQIAVALQLGVPREAVAAAAGMCASALDGLIAEEIPASEAD